MTTVLTGWHWLRDPTRLSDGTPLRRTVALPPGEKPVLGKVGFHASREPLSALFFAPGTYVCRVRLAGRLHEDDIQAVGTRRELVAGPVDASRELRLFAAECARSALVAFEVKHPDDPRVRRAIAVARCYVSGKASDRDLEAARSGALAAAGSELDPGAEHAARAAAEAAHPDASCAAWWAAWESSNFSPYWGRRWSEHDRALAWRLRKLFKPVFDCPPSEPDELFR
ncbi:MAG: hypothetical protein M0027_01445 [Candidatus Dormibacteraeota bacterium]|jgi:hypothetical protein|nr:hypothetical protein [Candidatus Dormibacteraeota bacterium]